MSQPDRRETRPPWADDGGDGGVDYTVLQEPVPLSETVIEQPHPGGGGSPSGPTGGLDGADGDGD